jgi:ligand-binding SRPBCC domain-containing protein
VRIGVVHGYPGGVLGEVVPLFKSHFGSAMGSGKQWMSWIDLVDLCEVFGWLLKKESWSPVYNAVGLQPVTNRVWSKSLAKALNVRLLPNVPSIALKLALGERASILLNSQKIIPNELLKEGFVFKKPTLESSLRELNSLFHNATYVFIAEQFVPRPLEEVFYFFSQAKNLEKISPPFLKFQVKNQSTASIQEGTVIDYRLKVRGIPARWRSKISNWNPPYEFSDLQELGPYKHWFHTHSFEAVSGGTLIRDLVRYKLPISPLGDWVAQKFVKSEIHKIFQYRQKVIRELFSK